MAVCLNHNWIETQAYCVACGRPFCGNCLVPFLGQPHCGPCRDQRLASVQGPVPATTAPLAGTGRVEIGRWVGEGWRITRESGGLFVAAILVAGILSLFSLYICLPAFMCGLYLMAFQKITTGTVSFGTLFLGFRRFKNAFLAGLLIWGISFVLFLALGIAMGVSFSLPGGEQAVNASQPMLNLITNVYTMVLGGLTFFVFPHIAARNAGPIEALSASWQVVRRNPVMFCVAYLALYIVSLLGVLACFIGIFFTIPIMLNGNAQAYADHFGLEGLDLA